jgi:hypothetical protein
VPFDTDGNYTVHEFWQPLADRPILGRHLAGVQEVLTIVMRQARQRLEARIDALETKIASLEQRNAAGPEYKGIFRQTERYTRGNLTTHRGGLWLALEDTNRVPGSNATSWKLIVKRGDATGD